MGIALYPSNGFQVDKNIVLSQQREQIKIVSIRVRVLRFELINSYNNSSTVLYNRLLNISLCYII